MKYPYIVNKDGVWYPAGAEVPEGTSVKEENKKDDFSQYMNPPEIKKSCNTAKQKSKKC